MKYTDEVERPLPFFLHSKEDYGCWLMEGVQIYSALQHFDVPTHLVIVKGENHELSRSGKLKNKLKCLEE